MTKQNVYRIVKVQGNDIVWGSAKFFLSKESAINECDKQAKLQKVFETEVEKYNGHKWDSVCMNEFGKDSWLTVEKVWKCTEKHGHSFVIGFVTYEAV